MLSVPQFMGRANRQIQSRRGCLDIWTRFLPRRMDCIVASDIVLAAMVAKVQCRSCRTPHRANVHDSRKIEKHHAIFAVHLAGKEDSVTATLATPLSPEFLDLTFHAPYCPAVRCRRVSGLLER